MAGWAFIPVLADSLCVSFSYSSGFGCIWRINRTGRAACGHFVRSQAALLVKLSNPMQRPRLAQAMTRCRHQGQVKRCASACIPEYVSPVAAAPLRACGSRRAGSGRGNRVLPCTSSSAPQCRSDATSGPPHSPLVQQSPAASRLCRQRCGCLPPPAGAAAAGPAAAHRSRHCAALSPLAPLARSAAEAPLSCAGPCGPAARAWQAVGCPATCSGEGRRAGCKHCCLFGRRLGSSSSLIALLRHRQASDCRLPAPRGTTSSWSLVALTASAPAAAAPCGQTLPQAAGHQTGRCAQQQ